MRSILRYGGIVLVVAACAFAAWNFVGGAEQVRAANPPPPPPPVPVTIASARTLDFPIQLEGLGTVQAFNSVEIRAQVNGILISVPIKEGQEVHKGDILVVVDPKPYQAAFDQATAQREEDQAQLQSAQLDLVRFQQLAKQSFAPVQQVDDQLATVNKLKGAIAADTAAIEMAQINLNYCVIRAPIDGRVSLYQLDVGNLVQASAANNILSITQDRPISVVFTLPESELGQVQAAMARGPVPVVVSAEHGVQTLATGTLLTPNNSIDTSTGTIQLKAVFANTDNRLWPGAFVDARVQVDVSKGALTVPSLAVEHGPNGLFVYVVKPDQTVQPVAVQVSHYGGGLSVVTQGLSPNDTVVVTGQARLAPGTHVNASPEKDPTTPQIAVAPPVPPT